MGFGGESASEERAGQGREDFQAMLADALAIARGLEGQRWPDISRALSVAGELLGTKAIPDALGNQLIASRANAAAGAGQQSQRDIAAKFGAKGKERGGAAGATSRRAQQESAGQQSQGVANMMMQIAQMNRQGQMQGLQSLSSVLGDQAIPILAALGAQQAGMQGQGNAYAAALQAARPETADLAGIGNLISGFGSFATGIGDLQA